MRAERV